MTRKSIYIFVIALLVGAGYLASDILFWKRYTELVFSKITSSDRGQWYSPVESVPGSEYRPLPVLNSEDALLNSDVLNKAENYVVDRNTSSFLIWHDGHLLRERYFDDRDERSLLNSKSLAKPIASVLMARAFQQGYFLSLDQSASDYIKEWKGTDKEKISIRNILNMNAGFDHFYQVTLNPFSVFHQSFLSGYHDKKIIDNLDLVDEPGTYYDYSQAVSDLLAVLIERATGSSYQKYLSEQLLKPLQAAGGEIWVNRTGGVAHSGCCIMLPAQTYLRIAILLANNGQWKGLQLIPDWWVSEILKGSKTNENYGLYFWLAKPDQKRRSFVNPLQLKRQGVLQSEPYAADDLFMFDGNGNQVIYIIPSLKLVIQRTGSSASLVSKVKQASSEEWDNTYLPNLLINALRNSK